MTSPHLLSGLGAAFAMFLSAAGSSAATVHAGMFAQNTIGIMGWSPVVISGVLAIYGMIIAVILSHNLMNDDMTDAQGYRNLSAGLAVGLSCLASGLGLAQYIRAYTESHPSSKQNNSSELNEGLLATSYQHSETTTPTWRFLAVLCFIEAIGLYGLIVALLMSSNQ